VNWQPSPPPNKPPIPPTQREIRITQYAMRDTRYEMRDTRRQPPGKPTLSKWANLCCDNQTFHLANTTRYTQESRIQNRASSIKNRVSRTLFAFSLLPFALSSLFLPNILYKSPYFRAKQTQFLKQQKSTQHLFSQRLTTNILGFVLPKTNPIKPNQTQSKPILQNQKNQRNLSSQKQL